MKIWYNYDLTLLNTFGVAVTADLFAEVESTTDIEELWQSDEFKNNEKLFVGGGSNILFTKDFKGIVVHNKLKGIEILEERGESVLMRAMSGELWQDAVLYAVNRGLWGLENLALIPGTVGGAPIQNIGAYGTEIKDVLESVEAISINTGERRVFRNEECNFGYRDSVFKSELKGKYFILSITLRLSKKEKKNTEYKVLKDYLESNNIEPNTSKIISEAVSEIRRSKLPDPKVIGNAGSFFKNIFVSELELKELLSKYPQMPYFKEPASVQSSDEAKEEIKIPTGWLVEQCGFKGKRVGNAGVHDKQALVLVNHGGATGQEIKDLAKLIVDKVYATFGLTIVPEVNIL